MADSTKRGYVFPWEPDYTNIINQVETDVGGVISAVDSVIPGVIPSIPTILPVIPSPAPTPAPAPPAPVTPAPSSPRVQPGDIAGALEEAAANAAEKAWPDLQDHLKTDFTAYMQSYLAQALTGNVTPGVPDITFNGQSLTRTAAKGHAIRAFLVGLVTTCGSAILTAIGQQTNLDFFTRDGWMATATLAVGTLINSGLAYFGRLQVAPPFEKQLAAAPPSVALLQMQKK